MTGTTPGGAALEPHGVGKRYGTGLGGQGGQVTAADDVTFPIEVQDIIRQVGRLG
jgi:hypothetical protein